MKDFDKCAIGLNVRFLTGPLACLVRTWAAAGTSLYMRNMYMTLTLNNPLPGKKKQIGDVIERRVSIAINTNCIFFISAFTRPPHPPQ